MAIDMGRRRCGIAVTDPLRIVANPLTTVATAELCEWVQRYIASEGLDGVVVGRPTDMQGRPSDSTRYIEPVVGRLRKLIAPVPVTYADERFTTVLARRAKRDIDAISASIILNDYITFNQ